MREEEGQFACAITLQNSNGHGGTFDPNFPTTYKQAAVNTSLADDETRLFGPSPILDLVENYAGSVLDLDRGLEMNGSALRGAGSNRRRAEADRSQIWRPRFVGGEQRARVFLPLSAVMSGGGSPVLLHAETPPGELMRLAESCGATFALGENWTESELPPPFAQTASLDFGAPTPLMCALIKDVRSIDQFPALPSVPLHPTSGTTGIPKIAIRPAIAAVAEARNYQRTLDVNSADRILCTVPMSHAYGFGTSAMLPLTSGASVVSTRRFNPATILRRLREQKITIFPAVPAMLDLLLLAARGPIAGLPRRVLSAGAPAGAHCAELSRKDRPDDLASVRHHRDRGNFSRFGS